MRFITVNSERTVYMLKGTYITFDVQKGLPYERGKIMPLNRVLFIHTTLQQLCSLLEDPANKEEFFIVKECQGYLLNLVTRQEEALKFYKSLNRIYLFWLIVGWAFTIKNLISAALS